jgi:hypothetical protein
MLDALPMSGIGGEGHTTDIFELKMSLKGYKCAGSRLHKY